MNELIKTLYINGIEVDVIGCWDKYTPENKFDFFDFFVDGQCINIGEPYYDLEQSEDEMIEDIKAHLEIYSEIC